MTQTVYATRESAAAARDAAIQKAHETYARRIAAIEASEQQSEPEVTTRPARVAKAWEMHQSGSTYRQIGTELGISAKAAHAMVREYQYALDRNIPTDLSGRAWRALHNSGFDIKDPASIAKAGQKRVNKQYNVGKVTMTEIAVWLKKRGYEFALD